MLLKKLELKHLNYEAEDNMIKISVVVPVYNVEKYIKKCIDSLLDQEFEEYEIIVINDGTIDNSMDYVKKVRDNTNKIIIYNQENAGLSAARNSGIRLARGKYILFCDSDDRLEKDCLSILYEEMEKNSLDLLLYDAYMLREDNSLERENPYNRMEIKEEIMNGCEILSFLIQKKCYLASACLYMINKDILIKNKLMFEEGIFHEDELFTPILLTLAQRVKHKNWLIYHRLIHEGSIMTGNNLAKRMEGLSRVIQNLAEFVDQADLPEIGKNSLTIIIKNHIRHFLAQTMVLKSREIYLTEEINNVYGVVKKNKLKLGIKFWIYLIWLKIKYGILRKEEI